VDGTVGHPEQEAWEQGHGLTLDAIARRLFIAPGTVKVHLSHIFAKLGITTRAELAAQAATHDLTAR
jgi:DNA-binding NarL/FixJ family response regulator